MYACTLHCLLKAHICPEPLCLLFSIFQIHLVHHCLIFECDSGTCCILVTIATYVTVYASCIVLVHNMYMYVVEL